MDTRQVLDEFQRTWKLMRDALDEKADEATVRKLNDRLDHLETKQQRLPLASHYDVDKLPSRKSRLFFKMVAAGGPGNLKDPDEAEEAKRLYRDIQQQALGGPGEAKALASGDDTTGGFLAQAEFVSDIVKGVQLVSPIRRIAKVRATQYRSVLQPVRSGVFAAAWVGESALRSETTGLSYSMEEIPVHEMYAYVIVSEQDLEDASVNLSQEIANEAAEQFAKAEGAAFVNGDKLKKPEGFMQNAAIAHEASGDANLLTGDGLMNLLYSLKEEYARNAYWVLNRKSLGAVRKLKDGTTNVYLWAPGIAAGEPNTILGLPYVEAGDMEDVAAGKFPVALGDFSRGYLVVDRIDIRVKQLNEKFAEYGQIGFIIRKRVGGQVILPEAIRKLEIASS